MNIVLIGYRGAGKSTVGRRLATRLGREFVDADDLLEKRQGALIRDIVKSLGWEHFRAMEKRIIEEISSGDNLVIAPGGGAVLDDENVRSLKKNGLVIWLKADRQVLYRRMGEDPRTISSRPTLTGKGTLEEFEEVMAFREPFYQKAADIQLDTVDLEVEEVVERILSILLERMRRA
jgi:shikimate kinase